MKIENEITGHVKVHTSSRLQIELRIKDEQIDFFTLDLESETVEIHVGKSIGVLLGMRRVYEGYIKLIADLGLEIPESYKKHWIPKTVYFETEEQAQAFIKAYDKEIKKIKRV